VSTFLRRSEIRRVNIIGAISGTFWFQEYKMIILKESTGHDKYSNVGNF
jgi:hypothetical protein